MVKKSGTGSQWSEELKGNGISHLTAAWARQWWCGYECQERTFYRNRGVWYLGLGMLLWKNEKMEANRILQKLQKITVEMTFT